MKGIKLLDKAIKKFKKDSLYRNAIWLISGSFFMSVVGFVYWILAARLFSPTQIGLAVTAISISSIVSSLSILGVNTTIIRFLSKSKHSQTFLSTAFTTVTLSSLLFGTFTLIFLPWISKELVFLQSLGVSTLLFILYFPLNTLNAITDSVFVAYKEAQFVFLSNTVQSLSKLLFLLLFTGFGIWGIFGSIGLSVTITLLLCLTIIFLRYKKKFTFDINKKVVSEIKMYAASNYVISIITSLPGYIVPILVTNKLSPEIAAYTYMPNMIGTFLTVIPSSFARSYFTESSEKGKLIPMKRTLLFVFSILVIILLGIIFFGNIILSFFGKTYAEEGSVYLIFVGVSVLVSVFSHFLGTRLLYLQKMRSLSIISGLSAVMNIVLTWWFIQYGVIGLGIAIVTGQLFGVSLYLIERYFYEH